MNRLDYEKSIWVHTTQRSVGASADRAKARWMPRQPTSQGNATVNIHSSFVIRHSSFALAISNNNTTYNTCGCANVQAMLSSMRMPLPASSTL